MVPGERIGIIDVEQTSEPRGRDLVVPRSEMQHGGEVGRPRVIRGFGVDRVEHRECVGLVGLLLAVHGRDREIDAGVGAIGIAFDHASEKSDGVVVVVAGQESGGPTMVRIRRPGRDGVRFRRILAAGDGRHGEEKHGRRGSNQVEHARSLRVRGGAWRS